MKPPVAIVCDFDGTVTTEDLGDRIAIHFGGYEAWRAEEDRYKQGGMSFQDLLRAIFRPVRASREAHFWIGRREGRGSTPSDVERRRTGGDDVSRMGGPVRPGMSRALLHTRPMGHASSVARPGSAGEVWNNAW